MDKEDLIKYKTKHECYDEEPTCPSCGNNKYLSPGGGTHLDYLCDFCGSGFYMVKEKLE